MGAFNGLALGVTAELVMRALYQYELSDAERTPADSQIVIDTIPYPFSWWYLPVLSFALVTIASVIAHRFLRPHVKSQIFLWPAIGALAVLELYLITAAIDWWNATNSPLQADYWQFAHSNKLFPWLLLVPGILVFNLLFGWLLRLFSKSDTLNTRTGINS